MAEKFTRKERREYAEKQYRLGQKSVRMIAEEIGVSHTTINKWVAKFGWVQDKSREVLEKTRAALVTDPEPKVSNKVSTDEKVSEEPHEVETSDVEIAVQTNVKIIRGHRKQVREGLLTVAVLREQLHDVTQCRDRIIDQIMLEDVNHQRRAAMLKAVSLTANAGVMRDLATALKHLIPIERQAFGLDEKAGPPPLPLADKLTDEQREALQRMADMLAKAVTQG